MTNAMTAVVYPRIFTTADEATPAAIAEYLSGRMNLARLAVRHMIARPVAAVAFAAGWFVELSLSSFRSGRAYASS